MSDDDTDLANGNGPQLVNIWWILFRGPGKLILWLNYMFPKPGRVWVSARQRGVPALEVFYSIAFWALVIFVIVALANSGGH